MTGVKNFMECNHMHLEQTRSLSQSIKYCQKKESATGERADFRVEKAMEILESGKNNKQGKRTDIDDAIETLTETQSLEAVASNHPKSFLRYHRGFSALRNTQFLASGGGQRQRDVTVWFLHGPPRAGKTHWVYHTFRKERVFALPSAKKGWFDGYDGHKVLFIDEIDSDTPDVTDLLKWLEGWPVQVQVKGGFAPACWTTVVMASNTPIDQWIDSLRPLAKQPAVRERITYVKEFKARDVKQEPIEREYICVE